MSEKKDFTKRLSQRVFWHIVLRRGDELRAFASSSTFEREDDAILARVRQLRLEGWAVVDTKIHYESLFDDIPF